MGLFTLQPFKALYVLVTVFWEVSRFPLWVLLYILPAARPHPQWTFEQAIRVRIAKLFTKHISIIQIKTPLSLKPGKEGDRFTVIKKQDSWAYEGPAKDAVIKPQDIGGVWTPEPLQRSQVSTAQVCLHFHGGAYAVYSGRDVDCGFVAKTLHKHAGATHVLIPAYRLATNKDGHFPAALQDAISSYVYLTDKLRVPANQITISGDSAGGNLALALLRYIHDHGSSLGLEWPGCVWLWSPWVNLDAALEKNAVAKHPRYSTDYLIDPFPYWGASSFLGQKHNARDAYISPLGHSFESKSPIFVQTGRAEVLYDDVVAIAKQFQAAGGAEVKLLVQPKCPHDIILIGDILGFVKDAQVAAKQAGEFRKEFQLGA